MQTTERHKPKPVRVAERRMEAAERRARSAEQRALLNAGRDTSDAARLAADLAEMREDRDRWRAQAERLAGALDRLRAPTSPPVATAPASSPAASSARADANAAGELDLLEGIAAIADALGVTHRRAKLLQQQNALPTFHAYPGSRIICARRSSLDRWLAERAAASQGGR